MSSLGIFGDSSKNALVIYEQVCYDLGKIWDREDMCCEEEKEAALADSAAGGRAAGGMDDA